MQIKTMRFLYPPIKMAQIQNIDSNTKCQQGCGAPGTSFIAGGEVEDRGQLGGPYKTKHTLTINPSITLLGAHPKDVNAYVHTKPALGCL